MLLQKVAEKGKSFEESTMLSKRNDVTQENEGGVSPTEVVDSEVVVVLAGVVVGRGLGGGGFNLLSFLVLPP